MIELMQILFWLLLCICATCIFILPFICVCIMENHLWIILLFIIIGICCGVGALIIDEPTDNYVTIYSLGDQLGVHGTFIMGSGYVDSEIVYVALLKHDENTYEQIIIKCNGPIYLIEDDTLTETGYVKWTDGKYSGWNTYESHYKLEIHVPKGTIIKSFNVNGQ